MNDKSGYIVIFKKKGSILNRLLNELSGKKILYKFPPGIKAHEIIEIIALK
jgi:hypothetical protein